MENILKEYNQIAVNKINQKKLLEEYNKNMNKMIENIKLPNICDFLTKNKGPVHMDKEYICKYCKKILPSQTGLNNHTRTCINK